MSQNWQPLRGRLLVERVEDVETKIGGIYIPETAKEKKSEGTVIAVGADRITNDGIAVPSELKVGDRVVFGKYSGVEVKINDETFITMKEEEVLLRKGKE